MGELWADTITQFTILQVLHTQPAAQLWTHKSASLLP